MTFCQGRKQVELAIDEADVIIFVVEEAQLLCEAARKTHKH
jgi:predicted GTPase